MVELVDASVQDIPAEDIEFLKPLAVRKGHSPSRAGICRFAVIELAGRCRLIKENDPDPAADTGAAR